jgi:hypothetical protein
MNNFWKTIWSNKEWLFSGIGVLFLSVISGLIYKKRNQEKKIAPQGQGHTYAAETMHIHHSSGLSVTDVKELAKSVFIENFPKLQEVAKLEAEKNRDLFIQELDKRIKDKLTEEEINKFNKPDIQYALKDAVITASRKDNSETRTILSNLIVERVKNDGIEFKEIVYNEAIGTIPRLTKNHLNILTFTFITKYARLMNVNNWTNFNQLTDKYFLPFIDFASSNAQFQHLEYSDCANLGLGSLRLESIFRKTYSNLFFNDEKPFVDKNTYDNWNLQAEIKPTFFTPNEDGSKYYFTHNTVEDFESSCKKLIENGILAFNDISGQYLNKVKKEDEISNLIKEKLPYGEKLIKQFNDTGVSKLTLTSVGIVIGASQLETTTGDKLDINIWIN